MVGTTEQKSNVNIVFGAMTFGKEGTQQSRVTKLEDCKKILDVFQAHGHNEIDTVSVMAACAFYESGLIPPFSLDSIVKALLKKSSPSWTIRNVV